MLADILSDIEQETGKVASTEDVAARLSRINAACKEIHDKEDLEEGKDEKVFNLVNDNSPQIALPPYVGRVRGMRLYQGRYAIDIDHARNRYNFNWSAENDLWYLVYREIAQRPLSRDINNQSILKFSVPLPETEVFSVTVIGSTDNSYQISETLTFQPGELEKITIANFTEVYSISKNIITKYNVHIKDVENNAMGMILNSEYLSYYKFYQISDTDNFNPNAESFSVEVWFKYKLQPLKNLTDCFLNTNAYDKAVFWKYMQHRSNKVDEAVAFKLQYEDSIGATIVDAEANVRQKLNFKPQPFFEIDKYGYGYTG